MSSIKLIAGSSSYSVLAPPGSIMEYLGKSDPDGWIICDGVTRTATDGRYDALATLLNDSLGGNRTSNSCTPPDLRSKFLHGTHVSSILGTVSGSTSKTITVENLPAHSHGVNDPGHNHSGWTGQHNHSIWDPGHTHGVTDPGHTHKYNTKTGDPSQSGSHTPCWYGNRDADTTLSYTGITINGAYTSVSINNNAASIPSGGTGITTQNTGSGTSLDIMPPYFTVNYIIKF